MIWELFLELVNRNETIVVAVMISEARDEQLMLDNIIKFMTLLHLRGE